MADTLNHQERIERYVNKSMSATEAHAFEQELQSNNDLSKEYKAYQAALKVMDFLAFQSLDQLEDTSTTKQPILRLSYRRILSIAAVVFALGLATYLIVFQARTSEKDYLSFYQRPYPDLVRSDQNEDNAIITAYFQEDYQQVIQRLERKTDLGSGELLLLAHAYLLTQQYELAIPKYNQILQDESDKLGNTARWHRLLAYLNTNQTSLAKEEITYFLGIEGYDRLAKMLQERSQLQ